MLAIESIAQQIEDMKKRAKLLNSATIKRLAAKYPDAEINVYDGFVDFDVSLGQYNDNPLYDISSLEGVWADGYGYNYKQDIMNRTYRIGGKPIDVRVQVRAIQPYTQEEKELLRAVGKIQTQTYESESLVCGI